MNLELLFISILYRVTTPPPLICDYSLALMEIGFINQALSTYCHSLTNSFLRVGWGASSESVGKALIHIFSYILK